MWKYRHTEFPSAVYRGIKKSQSKKRLVDGAQHLCYWALVDLGLCNLTRKKEKRERSFDMLRLEHCRGKETPECSPGKGAKPKKSGI